MPAVHVRLSGFCSAGPDDRNWSDTLCGRSLDRPAVMLSICVSTPTTSGSGFHSGASFL